jgi:Domain of unknown function (DUF6702)
MLRRLLSILLIVGAGAVAAPAFAHQQKAALTELLFNPRSGTLEIVHRFYLHDAEQAVQRLFGAEADIHGKQDTRFKFARYTVAKFALWDGKDMPIELGLVGFEIEGNYFWVYQESETKLDVKALTIRHDALRDIWPAQMNTVNIEGKGPLQTVLFSGENTLEHVTFN